MAEKNMTIYDIANALSLSPSTVSRALKENKRISKKTIKRVLDYAKKYGYQTNAFASNLRNGHTKTIGIIVPRLDSKFISSCLAGAEKVAAEKGYSILISQSLEDFNREKVIAQSMFNKRVDGLLISLAQNSRNYKHFKPFLDKGIPVLFFDRIPESHDYPSVVIDNYKAAYNATKHLIDRGCKHLLHLTMDSESGIFTERYNGFKAAIKKAGLPNAGQVIKLHHLAIETGRAAADLIDINAIDGIFAANDQAAIGCMNALQKKGISIPNDIAFVGFNNDSIGSIVSPTLSSINYPALEMGTQMTNHLIEHILGNSNLNLTQKTVLKSELVIRESSSKTIA